MTISLALACGVLLFAGWRAMWLVYEDVAELAEEKERENVTE